MTFKFSHAPRHGRDENPSVDGGCWWPRKSARGKLLTLTCGLFFKCIWRANSFCFVRKVFFSVWQDDREGTRRSLKVRRGEKRKRAVNKQKDLRVFAKSSTDYIKCVLNCFAWEHQQLARCSLHPLATKLVSDVMLKKYWIMFGFQLFLRMRNKTRALAFGAESNLHSLRCDVGRSRETHKTAFHQLEGERWSHILNGQKYIPLKQQLLPLSQRQHKFLRYNISAFIVKCLSGKRV